MSQVAQPWMPGCTKLDRGGGHSCDGGSLMRSTLPVGQKVYLSEHDWTTLRNFYLIQHPVGSDS